jgi:patatin-related protein
MGTNRSKMEIRREVRFAVVMYGGISLAIYINGVAQELFHMVRATAGPGDGEPRVEEPRGTESVYRELGQILGREATDVNEKPDPSEPIHTRFVVDVLSGTSAGGINAVYLAKALANGQDFGRLKRLWIEEGDIVRLINDAGSVEDLNGFDQQKPPKSLLNGERMYVKLLCALDDMGEQADSYQEQVDLFVTTTDFEGFPVFLQTFDKPIAERRHRNVFHLRYGSENTPEPRNDFDEDNTSFLAFMARATSAFPFAFEPIRLRDVDKILKKLPDRQHLLRTASNPDRRQEFFPDYLPAGPGYSAAQPAVSYLERIFVDGGYLDNKPFGYAVDALASRSGWMPTDRKLIYIDPSPEVGASESTNAATPDAIENTAAVYTMARYETIREDLERILARNRLIERVGSITAEIERDVKVWLASEGDGEETGTLRDPAFADKDLTIMIEAEGVAYGGYHRLKIAALTDEIAKIIARAAGVDVRSAEYLGIRFMVKAWRESNYVAYFGDAPPAEHRATQNRFLVQYDLTYRLRRLDFCLHKISQLHALDNEAAIKRAIEVAGAPSVEQLGSDEERPEFRKRLRGLHKELSSTFLNIYRAREKLMSLGPKNPLDRAVKALIAAAGIDAQKLRDIAGKGDEEQCLTAAKDLVFGPASDAFLKFADDLKEYVYNSTSPAAEKCHSLLLGEDRKEGPNPFANLATEVVRQYYDSYERYDMISYPILYATEVGQEMDAVEVVRVSPEDATSLINEKEDSKKRRKLAGTSFYHFGAFFDRGWRRNDLLWGRLDGAERIISTLLPPGFPADWKDELLQRAQCEILTEELGIADENELTSRLTDLLTNRDAADPSEDTNSGPVMVPPDIDSPLILEALEVSETPSQLPEFIHDDYEVNRQLNLGRTWWTLSRSIRVAGQVINESSKTYQAAGGYHKVVGRLLRVPSLMLTGLGGASVSITRLVDYLRRRSRRP